MTGRAADESTALDPAVAEARALANLALEILGTLPVFLGDLHPDLDDDRLPRWAGGEADTWRRGIRQSAHP